MGSGAAYDLLKEKVLCIEGNWHFSANLTVSGAMTFLLCSCKGISSDSARLLRLLHVFGFFILAWNHHLATRGVGEGGKGSSISELESFTVRHYIMPCSAVQSWKPLGDIPRGSVGKERSLQGNFPLNQGLASAVFLWSLVVLGIYFWLGYMHPWLVPLSESMFVKWCWGCACPTARDSTFTDAGLSKSLP